MEPFVDRQCLPIGGGCCRLGKAVQTLEQFGCAFKSLKPSISNTGKGLCQDCDVVDLDGNEGASPLHQNQRNVIDADHGNPVGIEARQLERCEVLAMFWGRGPEPDDLPQRGRVPEHRSLPGHV